MTAAAYAPLAALVDQVVERRQSNATTWPDLNPLPDLVDDLPAAFPFDALGPVLGPAAKAIAEHVQAPDALAGGSVLSAAAVAAQAHADVMTPHGRRVPLSLFVATSALSGDRKSATDEDACAPIDTKKKNQARQHARDLRAWHDAKKAAKPGDDIGSTPVQTSITVSKGTPEGLHDLLRNQSHIGLFSPEGAELLAGHGMRDERRTAGVAWLLKAWGAEALDDLTRGKGLSVLIGRRVSMHIMVQPVILQTLMADPLAQGQGLVARCLIAAPQTLAGTRKFKKNPPLDQHNDVNRYFAALEKLLNRDPLTQADGDGHELTPRAIGMTAAAEALWIEAYDDVELRQAPGNDLAGVTAWAGKFGEHTARIAGVITMANDANATAIDDDTMLGAIQVADFYLGEHLRLMGQSVERLRAERLRILLDFMHGRGPRVPHADVLQYVTRSVRKLRADGINPLLHELAARGYIRRDGDTWEVRPRA
jgi:putative DNA primase/helicase